MRKYRSRPPLQAKRLRSDDGWLDYNAMDKNITVYEADTHWTQIPILHPDTERPIEVYTGPDPIGFVWFEEDAE
jgi:hypothetical protein